MRQGSKKEERKGSPRRDTKTIGIYFAPALPSRIQKREKRMSLREEKQNNRDLFCPYLAPRIQKRRKRNGCSEQTNQNKKDLYRPYPALEDSKREETKWLSEKKTEKQPLFAIPLCTKKTRQGAEIRRIFLQFSLPCERDRGNETATDLSSQKQKGRNGLRKIPIQPLL